MFYSYLSLPKGTGVDLKWQEYGLWWWWWWLIIVTIMMILIISHQCATSGTWPEWPKCWESTWQTPSVECSHATGHNGFFATEILYIYDHTHIYLYVYIYLQRERGFFVYYWGKNRMYDLVKMMGKLPTLYNYGFLSLCFPVNPSIEKSPTRVLPLWQMWCPPAVC